MRSKRIFIILSCVLAIGILCDVEHAVSKSNLKKGEEVSKEYSKVNYKDLNDKVIELNNNLELNVGKLQGEGLLAIENIYEYNFQYASIGLDYLTGEIRFFKTKDNFKEQQSNSNLNEKNIKEKISRYYNILINKSDYKISKSIKEEGDFITFSLNLKLNDHVISPYNSLKIITDKEYKNIIEVNFINNEISNKMNEINISKEEAEKIVRKFILVNKEEYCGDIHLGIVASNNEHEKYKARIAWIAKVKDEKNNESFVHIDSTEGTVIGGNWSK